MINFTRCTTVCFLLLTLFACKKPVQIVPNYTVSKVFKGDSATIVNVHINSRMTDRQLMLIAAKLKSDSAKINNLEIHFLLPGNADISAGKHSYYAFGKFLKENEVKPTDTLKDENASHFRLIIYGLSPDQAMHLLTLQPKEIAGKQIKGRFIDDYNHTVIIPFKSKSDLNNNLYIIELDSAAKVVSATMPLKTKEGGVEKWLVTQNGDYITLHNGVLAQYAGDGLGVPFNSIKSGI